MTAPSNDPRNLLAPRRRIAGISAILLPFDDGGSIDFGVYDVKSGAEGTALDGSRYADW
jgi:hypothetical protein